MPVHDTVRFCVTCQTPRPRATFQLIRTPGKKPREVCEVCARAIRKAKECVDDAR